MKNFGFTVAHEYTLMKCCAEAECEEDIIDAVNHGMFESLNGYDCVDEYELEVFREGYKLEEIWS